MRGRGEGRRGCRCAGGGAEGKSLTWRWMRLQKYFRMSSRLEAACSSRSLCRAWERGAAEKPPELSQSPPSGAGSDVIAKLRLSGSLGW